MLNKLNEEIKLAMKAKNGDRLVALRCILSDAKNTAINNKRKDVIDDDILSAVNKGIKQRQDSIEQFTKANRQDLIDVEVQELSIYKEFQPQQLTEEEVTAIVDASISELGATTKKEMGAVMNKVMSIAKGKADGKMISRIVNSKLN